MPLPYLDQFWGGGQIFPLEYLPEFWVSQSLGGKACPGAQPPGLGRAPPRLPYHDRGGEFSRLAYFAGVEDFAVFGWRSLPGGTAPGPRHGPTLPLPYLDRGGGKFSHLHFLQALEILDTRWQRLPRGRA